jgi:hypothetical protein
MYDQLLAPLRLTVQQQAAHTSGAAGEEEEAAAGSQHQKKRPRPPDRRGLAEDAAAAVAAGRMHRPAAEESAGAMQIGGGEGGAATGLLAPDGLEPYGTVWRGRLEGLLRVRADQAIATATAAMPEQQVSEEPGGGWQDWQGRLALRWLESGAYCSPPVPESAAELDLSPDAWQQLLATQEMVQYPPLRTRLQATAGALESWVRRHEQTAAADSQSKATLTEGGQRRRGGRWARRELLAALEGVRHRALQVRD